MTRKIVTLAACAALLATPALAGPGLRSSCFTGAGQHIGLGIAPSGTALVRHDGNYIKGAVGARDGNFIRIIQPGVHGVMSLAFNPRNGIGWVTTTFSNGDVTSVPIACRTHFVRR